jgi:dihydropteroate synthase
MGVLNVTPDSFSDGGHFLDPGRAVEEALRFEREGAHFIDVGGESSRPGAKPVSAREEIRRILPVLKRLAKQVRVLVSVDTWKAEVAQAALDEGAVLVNDIRALRSGRTLAKYIARYRAGVVLMHMRGTPRTMQKDLRYGDLMKEITRYLKRAAGQALEAGIARNRIVIDPGFGFGKTTGQNLEMLARLEEFSALKLPVLAGLSRKSFIGNVLGVPVGERLHGSLAAAALAIRGGAHILRVHDVKAHRDLAAVVDRVFAEGREA